jgi:hypothetical protein
VKTSRLVAALGASLALALAVFVGTAAGQRAVPAGTAAAPFECLGTFGSTPSACPASTGQSETPTYIEGNPDCASLGYTTEAGFQEIKFEPVAASGSDSGVSYTYNSSTGEVTFTSSLDVFAAILKGGNPGGDAPPDTGANVYDYGSPGVASDAGLFFAQGSSHIAICVESPALAVTTSSFRATRFGKSVVLRWRTASEVDTLGFRVYRLVRGQRVQLTKRMIPAASLLGRPSNAYSVRVRMRSARIAAASRYLLAEVHTDGRRTWYGPVRAGAAA